uniref:Thioredoxin domain-containing protein n=1 Tax=Chromera velia CCMP2878 TaxID=1169474 RepID=A0A0G4GPW0_9ALVE|mmetsp:Transcript_53165/g.104080  ORF Transcript_53165/g.104080 Transcript_53165/m.104080 type:complete len:213 (+) Transcript_53165:190-828(+)|eukprot:Cvel_22856.t1-p1 / transcript=Cvel_22856.t1 / gene=Cvel_22856 / organism=Chromera_velia_CCMP2878 / gene_product=hypothetical protein / transcript_product=hypothetical protein / location=Cvel_scaffold2293:8153-8788(-) / protein_length=212 / sequence_SO=supercontig / SO=protein_coding / is_pseudo=false
MKIFFLLATLLVVERGVPAVNGFRLSGGWRREGNLRKSRSSLSATGDIVPLDEIEPGTVVDIKTPDGLSVFRPKAGIDDRAKSVCVSWNVSWSIPGKYLRPVFEKLAQDYPEWAFYWVHADSDELLMEDADDNGIDYVPETQIWRRGQMMEYVRGAEEDKLRALLDKWDDTLWDDSDLLVKRVSVEEQLSVDEVDRLNRLRGTRGNIVDFEG